jgi:hypothetical protein
MPAAQRSRNLADSLPATLSEPGSGSMLLSGREENRHLAGGNGAGLRPAVEEACGSSVPAPSAAGARPYERDQAVGQRRRLSCPTRRSSSATRCRRAAFSAWSQATVAAVSLARVCRQRATRHRGKQTRCERRPVGGRPQTAHRPGSNGVRTPPDATSGMGPGGPWPGPANLRLGGAGRQMAYPLLTRQARIACG